MYFFGGQRIGRRDYSNNVYYYASDHLGTSRVIAEVPSGSTTATLCYDADFYPFGGERSYTSNCAQNYKFTGKERDSESGLDNFLARYDSSAMGRFMSPDPMGGHLGNPQTLNRYSYVINNPLNLVDPFGLDSCTLDGAPVPCSVAAGALGIGGYGSGDAAAVCPIASCDGYTYTQGPNGNGFYNTRPSGPFNPYVEPPPPAKGTLVIPFMAKDYFPLSYFAVQQGQAASDGDVAVEMDIWHCPGCQGIWNSTANGMNEITAGYTILYGGAFLGATAAPYAASLAAQGIGWGYATVGGSAAIVLGTSPAYTDAAEEIGARALDMPDAVWNALSFFGETWTANQAFLDTAISRGYPIYLATPPGGGGTNFWLELQYLTESGINPASLPQLTVPH